MQGLDLLLCSEAHNTILTITTGFINVDDVLFTGVIVT